jgi:hypothetical protein
MPHSEHVVRVSGLTRSEPRARFALHCLQCFGSFLNCLSWKNTCSPAVNTKSEPQSTHLSTRSVNSMTRFPHRDSPKSAMVLNERAGPGSLVSFSVQSRGPDRLSKIERLTSTPVFVGQRTPRTQRRAERPPVLIQYLEGFQHPDKRRVLRARPLVLRAKIHRTGEINLSNFAAAPRRPDPLWDVLAASVSFSQKQPG